MDPSNWAVAIAIAAHGVLWFFKTPSQSISDIDRRYDDLSNKFYDLSIRVQGFSSDHDARLVSLTDAMKNNSDRLDKLIDRFNEYLDRKNGIGNH